jgi:hypothetical protein
MSGSVRHPIRRLAGGRTARISRSAATVSAPPLVRGLPSDQTSPAVGGTVSGIADVTFIGHRLYACWAGAAAHWWTLASGPTD